MTGRELFGALARTIALAWIVITVGPLITRAVTRVLAENSSPPWQTESAGFVIALLQLGAAVILLASADRIVAFAYRKSS